MISKRVTVKMKPQFLDPFDSISIIGFLCNFRLAFETSGLQDGAAMLLLHFFMESLAFSALHTRLASNHKARTSHTLTEAATFLTAYSQVVIYLLWTLKEDDNNAHTKDDITMITKLPNKTPSHKREDIGDQNTFQRPLQWTGSQWNFQQETR